MKNPFKFLFKFVSKTFKLEHVPDLKEKKLVKMITDALANEHTTVLSMPISKKFAISNSKLSVKFIFKYNRIKVSGVDNEGKEMFYDIPLNDYTSGVVLEMLLDFLETKGEEIQNKFLYDEERFIDRTTQIFEVK